jgi:hypothetical protein
MSLVLVTNNVFLQVIWHKVFLEDEEVINLFDFYFQAMGQHRLAKQSIIFANFAKEIGNLVMKNKKQQKTR